MRYKVIMRRYLAVILTAIMVFSICPTQLTALAVGGSEEHEHDENCGYVEAVEGQSCAHVHDANCGYSEGTAETPCDMECTDTDEDGTIDHAEGYAYQPATEGTPCLHEHDDSCGYVEAVEGQPCSVLAEDAASEEPERSPDLTMDNSVEDMPDLSELDTDGAAAFLYDDEDASMVLSLLGVDEQTNGVALENCRLKAYYVQYRGAIASVKDNTTLMLVGNGVEATQSVKYQLQFHNDIYLEAGEVSIKLPYVLYTDRYGDAVVPTDIGVPAAPAQSAVSSFNYTLVTEGDVEYIVFSNNKPIKAGANNIIQVLYQLDDMASVDEQSDWSLQPELTVSGASRLCDATLVGNMDTSTNLSLTEKTAYIDPYGSNIYPELYTWGQVCSVTRQNEAEPEDFADYRYVLYRTTLEGTASQPWDLVIVDSPGEGGEVVAQALYGHKGDHLSYSYYMQTQTGDTFTLSNRALYALDDDYKTVYLYSVVRYPVSSFPADGKVTNTITATMTGVDDKIDHILTSEASHVWEDYYWRYDGDIIHISKYYASILDLDNTETAWLDYAKEMFSQGSDVALPQRWTVLGVMRGYSYVLNDPEAVYELRMIDDLQYVRTSQSNYQRMAPDDYYYRDISFNISESSIDTYEDKTTAVTDGLPVDIYVMTADQQNEWQLVAEVPFAELNDYAISDAWYERGIYRIRADHKSNQYSFDLSIYGRTVLRCTSATISAFVTDEDVQTMYVMNTAGGLGVTPNGTILYDDEEPTGLLTSEFEAFDTETYGGYLLRRLDDVALTRLEGTNAAQKYVSTTNDPVNGEVKMTYTLTAYEGYSVFNADAVDVFKDLGISPADNQAVFYDLLPLGIKFDASRTVTVGQYPIHGLTDTITNVKSWNTADMNVDWSVVDNYKGSDRQLVVFTLEFTGEPLSNETISISYYYDRWVSTWAVQFGAYYKWEDYSLANSGINVMAYDSGDSILGNGYTDDGRGVPSSVGYDADGKSYFYDIDGDGVVSDTPHLIYAQAAINNDIAVAASALLDKTVKADADIYAPPSYDASVECGAGYTYTLHITNVIDETKGIILFDRLENAAYDKADTDSRVFEDTSWQGAFNGVNTEAARAKGAAPVVYYSASATAAFDLEDTASAWVLASDWKGDISGVKAVGIDLSKTVSGDDFSLVDNDAISVDIHMTAPAEKPEDAVYAYNNAAFESYTVLAEGSVSEPEIAVCDSTSVKLQDSTTLTVEKTQVTSPEDYKDTKFRFVVKVDGAAFAYREYTLFSGDVEEPGVYATDRDGALYLSAGQRAVFNAMPVGSAYQVTEVSGIHWQATPDKVQDGSFAQGENVVCTFSNSYRSLLFFEKQIRYAQDYTNGNEDTFTFQLKLNGEIGGNQAYYLVDREVSIDHEPVLLNSEAQYTDEAGGFTLKAGQRIVIPVPAGTVYSIQEVSMSAQDDYICTSDTANGTVNAEEVLASIINDYRYKDLYVEKTVSSADGVAVPDVAFSFTLELDGAPAAVQYILYEKAEDATTGELLYQQIDTGTLGADGRFELKDGQQIRFIRLEKGTAYTVTEDPAEDFVIPASAEGRLPTYAPSASETFDNEYLLKNLEVSKEMLAASEADLAQEFTFAITVDGQLYTNQPYTLMANGAAVAGDFSTDAQGQFKLKVNETAVFAGMSPGTSYGVQELPTVGYTQVSPVNEGSINGEIQREAVNSSAVFVNVSNEKSNLLIINKLLVSDTEGLVEDSLYVPKITGGTYPNWTYEYQFTGGFQYTFSIEVNGAAYANQTFTRYLWDGTSATETTDANGQFKIRATDTVVFDSLAENDSYVVTEVVPSRYWDTYIDVFDRDSDEEYGSQVQWKPVNSEDAGTMDGALQQASITNKLTPMLGINIEKYINGGTFCFRYDGKDDQYLHYYGKIWFKITLRDEDGNEFTQKDAYQYMQYGGEYGWEDICSSDENGMFYMLIDPANEYYGEVDGYVIAGYDIKIEEMYAEPAELMGELAQSYLENDYCSYDADGFMESATGHTELYFNFCNINKTEKLTVSKALSEADEDNRDFTFTLYRTDPYIPEEWDAGNGVYEPETYSVMPEEPFLRYDSATGEPVTGITEYTDANGVFTLKAGQYVQFDGLRDRDSEIHPGHNRWDVLVKPVQYKIVETPYANYTPQVVTTKDGVANDPVASNTAIILAGDSAAFTNTHGDTASLVVSKKVTHQSGVTPPADDTFTFVLRVDGKRYANETYTLYGADGNILENVQTVNGYEVILPWTTNAYGEFSLQDGQRAVFDWVGAGKAYEVTEKAAQGYVQITPASGTSASGIMTAQGASVEFVNAYDKGNSRNGSLIIRKLIAVPSGIVDVPDETFTFHVTVGGQDYAMQPYSVYSEDGTLVSNSNYTTADGKLTLKGRQYAVLDNVPVGKDYAVTEELAEGSLYSLLSSDNTEDATTTDAVNVTFTNSFGNLLVGKQVTSVGEAAPSTDVFTFKLSVNSQPSADTAYWVYSATGTKLSEGVTTAAGQFTLKADQYALFLGLPSGASYSVVENAKAYYTQIIPASGGYEGTVQATVSRLMFVNEYSKLSGLEITKTVVDETGNEIADDTRFTFAVTVGTQPYANKTYRAYAADGSLKTGIFTTDANGQLSLAAGERAVFNSLISGVRFSVSEMQTPDNYSVQEETISGTITNDGARASFVNIKAAEPEVGSLSISKRVTGNEGDRTKAFHFTVVLTNAENEVLPGSYAYTGTGVEDGTISSGETISLAHGQSITINGLPIGTKYSVTEQESNQDGYITTASGENGVIGIEAAAVRFTNEKSSGGSVDPVYGSLTVSKIVTGNAGETDREFNFVVTFSDGGTYHYTGSKTGSITSGGTVSLRHGESITIGSIPEGVTYSVVETEANQGGYTTSTSGDGTSGNITNSEKTVVFINNKTTSSPGSPEYGNLTITKSVTGSAGDTTREFTFTVRFDSTGSYQYTGSKSGTINSGESITLASGQSITILNLPAGITYSVVEVEADQDGYATTATGSKGTIIRNDTVTAAFINNRTLTPSPVHPDPDKPSPNPSPAPTPTPAPDSDVPRTDDMSNQWLWWCLAAISACGLLLTALYSRKHYRKTKRGVK